MSTTSSPLGEHIAWTVAHATNTLRFEHVGCRVGDGAWTHPLDDIPLPLTETHEHCACCGLKKRLVRGNGSAEAFRLDHAALRAHLIAEGQIDDDARPDGISWEGHDSIPGAIVSYFETALDAHAVIGIGDVEVVVYECAGDALIVTVREEAPPRDAPWRALRQVATMSLEPHDLAECGDATFCAACETLEEILRIASGLVPSLRALQLLELGHEALASALRGERGSRDLSLANVVVAAGGALVRREL